MARPSHPYKMAMRAVREHTLAVKAVCAASGVSEACRRHREQARQRTSLLPIGRSGRSTISATGVRDGPSWPGPHFWQLLKMGVPGKVRIAAHCRQQTGPTICRQCRRPSRRLAGERPPHHPWLPFRSASRAWPWPENRLSRLPAWVWQSSIPAPHRNHGCGQCPGFPHPPPPRQWISCPSLLLSGQLP